MIGIHSEEEIAFQAVSTELEGHVLVRCAEFEQLAPLLPRVDCLIVVARRLRESSALDVMDWTAQTRVGPPMVLVTDLSRTNTSELLKRDSIDHIVWWSELEYTLRPLVLNLSKRAPLIRLARAIDLNPDMAEPLRSALASAIRSESPPRTVRRLALTAGIGEEHLRYLWRTSVHGQASLKGFLDALILFQALRVRPDMRSWASVAGNLGLKERTLQDMARRLTGQTLGSLHSTGLTSCQRRLVTDWISIFGR